MSCKLSQSQPSGLQATGLVFTVDLSKAEWIRSLADQIRVIYNPKQLQPSGLQDSQVQPGDLDAKQSPAL